MTKPISVPTWATDTNYPASSQPWASSATKVQPSSGKQALGWEPEEPPPAQYENWWRNLVGQWTQYVSDKIAIVNYSAMFSPIFVNNFSWSAYPGNTGYLFTTTDGALAVMTIPLEIGQKLTALSFNVFGNTTVDYDWYLVKTVLGVSTTIANATVTNEAASWRALAPSFTSFTLAAGESVFLQVLTTSGSAGGAGLRLGNVLWTAERP